MRILEFFGEPLSYGGQEAFIFNMYSHFKNDAKYNFITPFHANNKELISLIEKKKDEYVAYNYRFQSILRKLYIIKAAQKSINRNYDIIHIHSGSVFNLMIVSYIAKKRGVKKVIVHSHATGHSDLKHHVIKSIAESVLDKNADIFLSCSLEAAEFKYSQEVVHSDRFRIIRNGINIDRFLYKEEYRIKIRKELKLGNSFVMCHVGRYSEEKNHQFIIEVYRLFKQRNPDTRLILVGGKGPCKEEIINRVESYGLSESVTMLTERTDVNEILSAADVFLFPSLFEGLGISAIEAQAAGLHTFCSENIPDDAKVSHLFHRIPLKEGAERWAEAIEPIIGTKREDTRKEVYDSGYSIEKCSNDLEKVYFG